MHEWPAGAPAKPDSFEDYFNPQIPDPASSTSSPSNQTSSTANTTAFASSSNNPTSSSANPTAVASPSTDSTPSAANLTSSTRVDPSNDPRFNYLRKLLTDPAYSTAIVNGSASYISRLVPGALVTQGNPRSKYQQFLNLEPDTRLDCTYRQDELPHCPSSWRPLCDYTTGEPLLCLNCGKSSHSIFGCPGPFQGAVIVWHYSCCLRFQGRETPRFGVVELAEDICPGFYDIDHLLWQHLTHNQVRQRQL